MADLNKVMLIGRLGADPEGRSMQNGEQVASFSMATSEKWKDKKTGEQRERTEWHRIVCFGSLAKVCIDWLKKGSQIYVEGQSRTRKWKDKEGNDRWTTEINIHDMKMISGTKERGEQGQAKAASQPAGLAPGPETAGKGDFEEDIPF
jgi:single-strand DNA-binding protein